MRLDTPRSESENRLIAWMAQLNWRQCVALLLALAGFAYAGVQGWRNYQARQAVYTQRMQAPPEVLEARKLRGSPFAPGLTREERRKAFEKFGKDFWQRTSTAEKVEVARGAIPEMVKPLKLRPEQQAPVQKVIEGATAAMIPIWDGWWEPNFNKAPAVLRSYLVAATARQQLEPILDAKQKAMVDAWMTKARERSQNNATTGTARREGQRDEKKGER